MKRAQAIEEVKGIVKSKRIEMHIGRNGATTHDDSLAPLCHTDEHEEGEYFYASAGGGFGLVYPYADPVIECGPFDDELRLLDPAERLIEQVGQEAISSQMFEGKTYLFFGGEEADQGVCAVLEGETCHLFPSVAPAGERGLVGLVDGQALDKFQSFEDASTSIRAHLDTNEQESKQPL